MNKRILVIEDEVNTVKNAFKLANIRKYGGGLEIKYESRSQDINYPSLRQDFDLVFVDITLANRSLKNGYGVIKDMLANNLFPKDKIIVLTGNREILEGLKQNGLPEDLEVLPKPLSFLPLEKLLVSYLPPEDVQ
ncbi:MAG: hypothetical protein HDS84_04780 [Bacteroidales bacterium]|nr:hypothetical protein [Bacteroidales bacterium]MBD5205671.1 hypothetical protein [Bacteroidales bacterium]